MRSGEGERSDEWRFSTLPCLQCRYDLRGSPAEVLRCPECGLDQHRRDIIDSLCLSNQELNAIGGRPFTCMTLFFVLQCGIILWLMGHKWVGYAICVIGGSWMAAVIRFGRFYEYKKGWFMVLARLHGVVSLGGLGAGVLWLAFAFARPYERFCGAWELTGAGILVLFMVALGIVWIHRRTVGHNRTLFACAMEHFARFARGPVTLEMLRRRRSGIVDV